MLRTGLMSDEVSEALEHLLGPIEGTPEALEGGITNRNLKVRAGGSDYVVRLCGKDTDLLGIDRAAELQATRAAHALGIGPEVVLLLPEYQCVVTRWVEGRQLTAAELRQPEVLGSVARALRSFHDSGPQLPASFDAFRLGESYREQTLERGGLVPGAFSRAQELMARIEVALRGPDHEPVACHNDLLTANFLLRGDGSLAIVDWEYAGMGDRYFDLGNLAVNNELSEDDGAGLLAAYWGEPPSERRLAALALMRLVSDYREGAWGMVQTQLSELDFDYVGYADKHLGRLLSAAEDPRLQRWLDAASS
jgi:thiamine kinase-like enzyme